jgi:hypothetical protein
LNLHRRREARQCFNRVASDILRHAQY